MPVNHLKNEVTSVTEIRDKLMVKLQVTYTVYIIVGSNLQGNDMFGYLSNTKNTYEKIICS